MSGGFALAVLRDRSAVARIPIPDGFTNPSSVLVTLVPEKRQELTTEGGLDIVGQRDRIQGIISLLHDGGIPVSVFIEPDLNQIKAAHKISSDFVELHTGRYSNASAIA